MVRKQNEPDPHYPMFDNRRYQKNIGGLHKHVMIHILDHIDGNV